MPTLRLRPVRPASAGLRGLGVLLVLLDVIATHQLGGGTHMATMTTTPRGPAAAHAAPAHHTAPSSHRVTAEDTSMSTAPRSPIVDTQAAGRAMPSHDARPVCLAVLTGLAILALPAGTPAARLTSPGTSTSARYDHSPPGRGPPRDLLAQLFVLRTEKQPARRPAVLPVRPVRSPREHPDMSSNRTVLPDTPHTTRPVTRRLAAAAAAGLALTLAACGNSSATGDAAHHSHSTAPSAVAAPGSGTGQHNPADVTFAQSMLPHHQQAVEMARMGATQASSPAVKELAAQIQAAQDPEISTMTGWLNAWAQPTAMSGGMAHGMDSMPGMMSNADMTTLGTLSGSGFDRTFLTMMTAHHTGAIEMARTELAQGQYGPAKELATSIVADQTAEIAKMKTLLTQV